MKAIERSRMLEKHLCSSNQIWYERSTLTTTLFRLCIVQPIIVVTTAFCHRTTNLPSSLSPVTTSSPSSFKPIPTYTPSQSPSTSSRSVQSSIRRVTLTSVETETPSLAPLKPTTMPSLKPVTLPPVSTHLSTHASKRRVTTEAPSGESLTLVPSL